MYRRCIIRNRMVSFKLYLPGKMRDGAQIGRKEETRVIRPSPCCQTDTTRRCLSFRCPWQTSLIYHRYSFLPTPIKVSFLKTLKEAGTTRGDMRDGIA